MTLSQFSVKLDGPDGPWIVYAKSPLDAVAQVTRQHDWAVLQDGPSGTVFMSPRGRAIVVPSQLIDPDFRAILMKGWSP